MNRVLRLAAIAVFMVALSGAAVASLARQDAGFPHARHKGYFPDCTGCHAGVTDASQPLWPSVEDLCSACHDGDARPEVTWKPREGPRPTNLTFSHEVHSFVLEECGTCHVESEDPADRMNVQRAVVGSCLACHELEGPHPDALPEASCSVCHLPLSEAKLLSPRAIAMFPPPGSHEVPGFVEGGHGKLATSTDAPVAASCATCHARNQCVACHVNAPEVTAIQALAADDRAPALTDRLPLPASHEAENWSRAHASDARKAGATCATCHTRESCRTCHSGIRPQQVQQLPSAGPGRGAGAQLVRTPPASHTWEFRDRHGPAASARPATCETCHVRENCLTCHIPNAAGNDSYHPAGFLSRHPASAWNRDANCSDCHNPAQFCQTCHKQAGLVAPKTGIGAKGYHDAFRGFSLGHGPAARQNLESCASCHAERDCTRCHAGRGIGYGFSPHGPGFDAERLKKKNPSLCVACHGTAIPGGK